MRRFALGAMVSLLVFAAALGSRPSRTDPRMNRAARHAAQNGWIFVHLEGSPSMIGFQHGFMLAPEIQDSQRVIAMLLHRDTGKSWDFFRDAAKSVLWPRVEAEYRQELQGIADGATARGVALDVWDITAMNAWMELSPYYFHWW